MPPMTTPLVVIPQSEEQEQEFELDIRVTPVMEASSDEGDALTRTCTQHTCHTACTVHNRCCTG